MKNNTLFLFLTLALLITSCGKDEVTAVEKEQKQEAIEEEIPVKEKPEVTDPIFSDVANTLSDNIIIPGSEKIKGSLPVARGVISMDVPETDLRGYLDEGFNIPIRSKANFLGAYIQFKTKAGGLSDSYYEIDLALNKSTSKKLVSSVVLMGNDDADTTVIEDIDALIDIDFSPEIAAGEFCYSICIFDDEGNISEPQDICITVVNWGGNTTLEGSWSYVKDERYYSDWGTVTRLLTTNVCYKFRTFYCTGGGSIDYTNCHGWNSLKSTFYEDGTFEINSESYGQYLNFADSDVACERIYTTDAFENLKTSGTWSYDAEKNELIQVAYSYEGENQNGTFNTKHEKGEGRFIRRQNVTVTNDSLIFGTDFEYPIKEFLGYRFYHTKD